MRRRIASLVAIAMLASLLPAVVLPNRRGGRPANTGAVTPTTTGETREYGIVLVGNSVTQDLACSGNTPGVTNFGAPNQVVGIASGQCTGV